MIEKVNVGIEVPLKADKPMIMRDEDIAHFKAMFTACSDTMDSFHQACSCIIEAAYLTDLHIDITRPNQFSTHIKPYAGFSQYVEYHVYNARTGYPYDMIVRIGKHPNGKYSVDFCRPTDKVRE